jgi:hypothetical protein
MVGKAIQKKQSAAGSRAFDSNPVTSVHARLADL